jgi:hypothetical protein
MYEDCTREADRRRNRGIVNLAGRYAAQLEEVKKERTRRGDIEGALGVKEEIERVRASRIVTAAEFALADAASRDRPSPQARPKPGADPGPCLRCGGTGEIQVPCPQCNGTGACAACGGLGTKRSPLRGSRTRLLCLSCKGTGRCPECGGKGMLTEVCPACKGAGRAPVQGGAPEQSPE